MAVVAIQCRPSGGLSPPIRQICAPMPGNWRGHLWPTMSSDEQTHQTQSPDKSATELRHAAQIIEPPSMSFERWSQAPRRLPLLFLAVTLIRSAVAEAVACSPSVGSAAAGGRIAYTLATSDSTEPDGRHPFVDMPGGSNPFPELPNRLRYETGPAVRIHWVTATFAMSCPSCARLKAPFPHDLAAASRATFTRRAPAAAAGAARAAAHAIRPRLVRGRDAASRCWLERRQ